MNKVFFASLLMAVLVAVVPYIQTDHVSWYSVGFAASIAITGFLTRNLKGQVASILGVVGAALSSFWLSNPEPAGIDWEYIVTRGLIPLLIQVLGAYIGPQNAEQKEG